MFFNRKNRRRFANGNSASLSAGIARRDGETLENRQLLAGAGYTIEAPNAGSELDVETVDAVFSDPSTAALTGDAAGEFFVQPVGGGAATEGMLESTSHSAAVALPAPPTVPAGLGADMTTTGTAAVTRAGELHSEITELRGEKAKCDEDVGRLENEVNSLKQELDDAKAEQDAAQKKFDDAKQANKDAQQDLKDQQDKLDDLQSQLQAARRARNNYAKAVSAAGRLARQARRRGDHGTADGFARQVGPNYEKYQEQVDKIRDLKKQIRETKNKIREAKKNARESQEAQNQAGKELDRAKKNTADAESRYNEAKKKLDEAKDKCRRLCGTLEAKEEEYLGEDGAHAAATSAIEEGQQRQQDRREAEEAERERLEQEEEDRRLEQHRRDHNEVIRLDLETSDFEDPGELTPSDINRLVGQQGGTVVPDSPTGEELAEAAAIKALNAQATEDALTRLAWEMGGMAWSQLTEMFPLLGAMSDLFETVSDFQQFVDNFRNGGLKVEQTVWAAEWGIVRTTTIYNCNTGQYIVTSQVLFYEPTGSQHAGGAGRDGIFIEPQHAGAYTVTFFGTVR